MNLVTKFFSHAQHQAIIDGSEDISHDQLRLRSLCIASGLNKEFSVGPGDRVVIIAHNSAEFLMAYLAVLSTGAVAIPLDPQTTDTERARDIAQVRPSLIITANAEIVPESYRVSIDWIEFHSSTWRGFLDCKHITPVERNPSDVAVMLMTSGVNFQPRPAMLTHGSLIANLEQASKLKELSLMKEDRVLAALPMYHIYGLHVVAGLSLAHQSTLIILRTFDPVEIASIIENQKITVVPAVPIVFEALAQHPQVTIDSFTSVRMFISGGAPMRSDVRQQFFERFGANIAEGYGLTEASPMVSFCGHAKREGDIGCPLPGVEVDVRDNSGDSALEGDAGQIVVRGDNVFYGYFGEREASSKVKDASGWLYTGDIGVKHDDGTITIIDRSSDVIVVYGFSVYPSEVEKVLEESLLVRRAFVMGELDEKSGEAVVAYLSLEDAVTMDNAKKSRLIVRELSELCSNRLAKYKIPIRYEFLDESQMSASLRPLRRSLLTALKEIE